MQGAELAEPRRLAQEDDEEPQGRGAGDRQQDRQDDPRRPPRAGAGEGGRGLPAGLARLGGAG